MHFDILLSNYIGQFEWLINIFDVQTKFFKARASFNKVTEN